jgi:hypothetical protein
MTRSLCSLVVSLALLSSAHCSSEDAAGSSSSSGGVDAGSGAAGASGPATGGGADAGGAAAGGAGGGPDRPPPPADFFIAVDGNDDNPGTEEEPWSITALIVHRDVYGGHIVELADGTYDVSAMVAAATDFAVPVINIEGGDPASPTVVRSHTPRGAHITAKNANGYQGPEESGILGNVAPYDGVSAGHVALEGLRISGAKSVLLRFGLLEDDPASGFYTPGIRVEGCELFDTDASDLPTGGNLTAATFNNVDGLVFRNNYVHDIRGYQAASSDHLSATLQWGTIDALYENNTIAAAGPLYGKRGYFHGQYDITIRFNYVDATGYTAGAPAIQDFAGADLPAPGSILHIHNNVLRAGTPLHLMSTNAGTQQTQSEDVRIYNNTLVFDSAIPAGYGTFLTLHRHGPGARVYNNVLVGPSQPGAADHGNLLVNIGPHALFDFNAYPSDTSKWSTFANGAASFPHDSVGSLDAWRAAIGGDEHASVVDDPGFVGSGDFAEAYRLAPGSPLVDAGRLDGDPSAAAVDLGAWGGAESIGHDW